MREDLSAYTGEIRPEWGNPSAQGTLLYHRFLGGTESALILTLESGTLVGTITANVRFDGTTPHLSGGAVLEHPIPFKCIASGADNTAIEISITNNDTSA